MPVSRDVQVEEQAIMESANLIAASARTAPKGRGVDNIKTAIVSGKEKDDLAETMEGRMERKQNPLQAFKRDAQSVRKSLLVLLIGVKELYLRFLRIRLIVELVGMHLVLTSLKCKKREARIILVQYAFSKR